MRNAGNRVSHHFRGNSHRNLTHVGLNGPIPKALERLTSLVNLDLGNNKVCKVCGPWLATSLLLQRNHVTGDLAPLAKLVNLETLWVIHLSDVCFCCRFHFLYDVEVTYVWGFDIRWPDSSSCGRVQDSYIEWDVSFEFPHGRISAQETFKFVSGHFTATDFVHCKWVCLGILGNEVVFRVCTFDMIPVWFPGGLTTLSSKGNFQCSSQPWATSSICMSNALITSNFICSTICIPGCFKFRSWFWVLTSVFCSTDTLAIIRLQEPY